MLLQISIPFPSRLNLTPSKIHDKYVEKQGEAFSKYLWVKNFF